MPTDTQQVMDAAEKLAQAVAQHPAVERYKQAQRAVSEDADASRLLGEFDRQIARLSQQQQAGMPVTDAQQQQLESLQSRIVSHLKVKALNIAQVDYVDLRRKIGQLLDKAVADQTGPSGGAGGGSGNGGGSAGGPGAATPAAPKAGNPFKP